HLLVALSTRWHRHQEAEKLMRTKRQNSFQRSRWRVGWVSRIKSQLPSRQNFFLDIPFYRTHQLLKRRIKSASRSEKLGRGGTDRSAKPLSVIQRVGIPPDQSRADGSVVSLAIHRATGGCRSVDNKVAGREDSTPKSFIVARPTWLR